jgi:peptidoglycan/LPS O-acetylase OafA/YrhL
VVAAHTGLFWTWPGLAARLLTSPDVPADAVWPLLPQVMRAFPTINFGIFGVALFFIISGFVIPYSFARYSGPAFLAARAWRLIPAYMACFAVTVGAIFASGALYDRPFPYDAQAVAFHAIPGLRMVMGSPAIDPVIWTLEIEVLFYAVCALAAPCTRSLAFW